MAIANAPAMCGASPATKPRPVSSRYVTGLSVATPWIQPLEKVQRHIDGREEEDEEHRHLHERSCLDRPEPHRDPAGPEEPAEVHERRERVEPDQIERSASDVHPEDERDHREPHRDDRPADERRECVSEHDPAPPRRREHEALRKSALEVACDAESGEDAAESSRLQEDEHELERGVPRREVEAWDLRDLRKPACKCDEEEEGEHQRRQENLRVRQRVLQRPPRHASDHIPGLHALTSSSSAFAARARRGTAT